MLRRFIYPSMLLPAVLIILLGACDNRPAPKKQAGKAEASPALPVDITVAREADLSQQEVITGTTLPFREVIVRSEVAQRVLQVGFHDGAFVSRGQLLYKLNDADLQARLLQLAVELKMAKLDELRLAELRKTEAVRQQEYDEVATRLSVLEAQRELLRAELSKTLITAPFAGKIGISKMVAGAYVTPNTELVSLQDQHQIKINFSVPERYLPLIKKGNAVEFLTELAPERYPATIIATEPGVDAGSRSILVQAVAANPGNKLRSGLSAKIFFSTISAGTKGIMVPTEALLPGGEGYTVYLLKGGTARMTPVMIGNRSESHAVITSGLQHGDSVIVSNTLRLNDGAPVQVATSK
ncbi:efflux RND transporter periplasmic adaptor subunit [Niabella beijingensis]|uniref:efflux RND transporter periplasmic adaptor subunit n=1 Tax=Niabella beijingensis TaxID=2872700 RepID=UPI001CBC49D7|nr:efflux RND transporter periplasmic adaptor subunit [Niabella beijingensis]MBZ4192634.1 efflux RND transporter periplasmic adaptor subunit [Niabella beijingensis]